MLGKTKMSPSSSSVSISKVCFKFIVRIRRSCVGTPSSKDYKKFYVYKQVPGAGTKRIIQPARHVS